MTTERDGPRVCPCPVRVVRSRCRCRVDSHASSHSASVSCSCCSSTGRSSIRPLWGTTSASSPGPSRRRALTCSIRAPRDRGWEGRLRCTGALSRWRRSSWTAACGGCGPPDGTFPRSCSFSAPRCSWDPASSGWEGTLAWRPPRLAWQDGPRRCSTSWSPSTSRPSRGSRIEREASACSSWFSRSDSGCPRQVQRRARGRGATRRGRRALRRGLVPATRHAAWR